jgi:hypothetical protein
VFSGGDYREVERWLVNFLNSHAKRESPRVEAVVEAEEEREGRSYGVRLRVEDRFSPLVELDYKEVAANRERLAWCAALAARVRGWARDLLRTDAGSA